MDVPPSAPPPPSSGSAGAPAPSAYVYAPSDIRPRQPREIELCASASRFDWAYTGTAAAGVIAGIVVNTQYLKLSQEPGVRLLAPGIIGFSWGVFLSGGYLSLPKCDPTWAYGPPPEGAVRAAWPLAAAISLLSAITAPAMDYAFLGPVKTDWRVAERGARVFVAMGAGIVGSLFPYFVSPRPWAAKREIERIRVGDVAGGPFVSYTVDF